MSWCSETDPQHPENRARAAPSAPPAATLQSAAMPTATDTLDHQYHEMRWRILSLAADFDRIERADGGDHVLGDNPRLRQLRQAMQIVLTQSRNRAEQVQQLLSDTTPPPTR